MHSLIHTYIRLLFMLQRAARSIYRKAMFGVLTPPMSPLVGKSAAACRNHIVLECEDELLQ